MPIEFGSRRRRGVALAAAALVFVTSVLWAGPARAADATLGLTKTASQPTVGPGTDFSYTLVAQCSGLTSGCVNAVLTDVIPPQVVVDQSTLPPSNAQRRVEYVPATRTLTVTFLADLGGGQVGLPAGSSQNFTVNVSVPDNSQIADGAVITNTGRMAADNATPVSAPASVTAQVPATVTPAATKAWSPSGAVAGSDEASTITLGLASTSSSSTDVRELAITDATPGVYDRFDVTGIGPVSFPDGADRVSVSACTKVSSDCSGADWVVGPPQTGPSLTFPGGITAASVTGLRFTFTSSTGARLPNDPTGGTVKIDTRLRDTLRSTGAAYSPTSRDDVQNCATPAAVESQLGAVSGTRACTTFSVQPAQATIRMSKSFFSDTNGDYAADGQAVIGQQSLVSALVNATNTSPFPITTMTITDPSGSAPSEFAKVDVSNLRIVFPTGATNASLDIDCGGGDARHSEYTAPPTTVNVPVPCPSGTAAGVTATYTGTIPSNAVATLGVQGRLNATVGDNDLPGGSSPGVSDCADGTATSSDSGIGAAAGTACGTVPVRPAFSQVSGVKSSPLPTILPGLPRRFDFSFKNNGTVAATNLVIADPADPAADPGAFAALRLQSLNLPASPAASAELYDPDAGQYVPYSATDTALLTRATGFRVTIASLPAGATYAFNTQMLLRDEVDVGTRIQNCAAFGTASQDRSPFCAPLITVLPQTSGAAIQKSITPATSVRPEPGLPGTPIQVKFATQNTGTLWLKRLVVVDTDAAFFDAVDATATINANFPPGADRVQVDTCTAACGPGDFTLGTRTASRTPPLPSGVNPADVRGFRITFSVADNSFTIRPGTNFPSTGPCTGASICVGVVPRAALRSDPGTPVPTTLRDTANGGYETTQQNGQLAPIPDTTATHTLTEGTAQLKVGKASGLRVAGPGDVIPYTLTLTNTGSGPIPDPTVVDPIPATLTFSPADPTKPYSIAYTQPTGAVEPATVDFAPTSDQNGVVTSLGWSFPGWDLEPGATVTITFEATLAPGVRADQVVTNSVGGSSSRPDLGCATGSPGVTDDPAYGPGIYCTGKADVRTRAGNAIQTAKWVAGDTTLGWLNSLTGELLPIGDPSCPRLSVDGQQFTRYPCVARVAPGQGFDYYLRVTNAGTNPATAVRLVDQFPAPGDTGVLLTDQPRGTQWAQPPTLLSPVAVPAGLPGAADVAYSAARPACTTDLNSPPLACPDGTWDLGYQPTATAFRALIDFPDGLQPGASTALRYRMAAPPAPTDPSQDEIAWNSFAHTEFFDNNGRIVQLPATEPIKTGVALVYGGFEISKTVIGTPSQAQIGPYEITYQCRVTPAGDPDQPVLTTSGTVPVGAGQSVRVGDVPGRASCLIWESDPHGLSSDAPDRAHAKELTIPVGGLDEVDAHVGVINTVPAVVPPISSPPGSSSPATSSAPPSSSSPATSSGPSRSVPGSSTPSTRSPTSANPDPTSSTSVAGAQPGDLAATGSDLGTPIRIAMCLLLAGGVLLGLGLRHRSSWHA